MKCTLGIALVFLSAAAYAQPDDGADVFDRTDRLFEDFRLDAHIPGLIYGVVVDGQVTHMAASGVQDLESRRPVTPDTLFRLASMTKVFTALTVLKLRDDGRLRLDALVEDYVPELKGWKYPTADSPRIRVRDLLSHSGGFVTDDPWGDRQTPLPEADFTRMLKTGVPFTRAPGLTYEYSNFGYALLGRIIANVSRRSYAEAVDAALLRPLGMAASGYDFTKLVQENRALGYRWENDTWRLEPVLAHGSFASIGGLQTSGNDYARWIAFLLSAWPARDGADDGPVKRATVRELTHGTSFPRTRERPGGGPDDCQQALVYSYGLNVATDCDLGLSLSHGGGYPGYGSHMVLFPERGAGLFVFANRTYAGPTAPLWDAAMALSEAGQLGTPRKLEVSEDLARGYRAAVAIFTAADIGAGGDVLALNMLMDQDPADRARDLAELKKAVGDCDTDASVTATGALSGTFTWRCAYGRVRGRLLLSPDSPARIQDLDFTRAGS
jgi:D-alanyl-D-alanine-carboxypeptidase/D-alanyl-D-alanine-endopeptidase